jgi:protein-S-isoprenylcysteine O-methyltransferase Ste14
MSTIPLVVAIAIGFVTALLTFLKVKGSLGFKILYSIFRGVVFFAIFYNPLIGQPQVLDVMSVKIIGLIALTIGLVLACLGGKQLVKTELRGIKGIPDRLITEGLYTRIRHPINLGLMLIFFGWYAVFPGVYSILFVVCLITALVIETFWEERNLIKKFGNEYLEYKENVGMFIRRRHAKD